VLGAIWALVGFVLLALAWLLAGGSSLPDWVSAAAPDGGSGALTALAGLLAVAAGCGQVLAGILVARGRASVRVTVGGLLLAAAGAVLTALWLLTGVAQQRPAWILLPPLAAYLYAAWALAFQPDRSRSG
jgi:hypothetical protein